MKEPLAVSVVQFCARHLVVVAVEIPTVWCVAVGGGKEVLDFDTALNGRQRHVLVVECRAPFVVHHGRTREVRFSRVLALLPAGDGALYGVDGLVASVLDEIRVQSCLLTHVVVGFCLQLGLARRFVFALPCVVYDVVGGPQKFIDGFAEKCGVVAVHVEFD